MQILEVNVSPGLTETSLLPMAAEAEGPTSATGLRQAIARG